MLYLFGTGAYDGNMKALKIGYTDKTWSERGTLYKIHNPLGKLIDTREGTELDEARLHARLCGSKTDFLDEWFYDEPDVYKAFSESYEEINKWIWENRQESLCNPFIPLPGTKKRQLFDELKEMYKGDITRSEKLI